MQVSIYSSAINIKIFRRRGKKAVGLKWYLFSVTVSAMTVLLFVNCQIIRNFLYSQISVFVCLCTLQIPLPNKHSMVFHQRSSFWDQYLHSKACLLIFCPRRREISGCKIKVEKKPKNDNFDNHIKTKSFLLLRHYA